MNQLFQCTDVFGIILQHGTIKDIAQWIRINKRIYCNIETCIANRTVFNEETLKQHLKCACKMGDLQFVKILAKNNEHLNDGFCEACTHGHLQVVAHLCEQGVDIHDGNDNGFQCACVNGHLNVVKYLVKQGINVHDGKNYALRLASENGHLQIVKYLVEEEGVEINSERFDCFYKACTNNHLSVVQYFVSKYPYFEKRVVYY